MISPVPPFAAGWPSPLAVWSHLLPRIDAVVWAEIRWPWTPAVVVLLLTGLLTGALVWRRLRRGRRQTVQLPADANRQMASLIERADCLLWESKVVNDRSDWQWSITTYRSALADRLFGRRPPAEIGLWHKFVTPENQAEMNRRARDAMTGGRGGYEQQFEVKIDGRSMWLHESVSIAPVGPGQYWLVGLVTDVTDRHLADEARRLSEDQLQQLLAHANCMLWQADVTRDARGDFHWEWFVPKSELYRRIVGEDPDHQPIMPWGRLNVPEYAEIEARSRHAMTHNLPGYEQEFRVVLGQEVLWMHEQTSITRLADGHWKLKGVVIDITAQRRAEEARHKSEERLGKLLDRADCLVWEATVTLKADDTMSWSLYTPKSVLHRRLFGGSPDTPETDLNWRGHNVPELPEMNARALHAIKSALPGYAQDFHMVKPDRIIWLHEDVTITRLASGQFHLVGVVTDITALREAESAWRRSEEHLRELLFRADCLLWEGMAELSKDGWKWDFHIQPSGLSQQLFGRPQPRPEDGLWRSFNIPEREAMNQLCRQAMETRRPGYEQIFHIIKPDGSVTWIKESVTLKMLGEARFSLVGVATDITAQQEAEAARQHSEARLRNLLTRADCILWEAKVALSPDDWTWEVEVQDSSFHQKLYGAERQGSKRGLWNQSAIPEWDEICQRCRAALIEGRPGYEQVFHINRDDGSVIWIQETVTVRRLGPSLYSLVGVATDITAQRQAEEAWRNSEGRLRKLLTRADCILWESITELTADGWKWEFEIQDSRLCHKLYGRPKPGSTAGLWRRFNIPEWEEMNHRCRTALTEGRPGYEQIFHILKEDGEVIWIQESVTIKKLDESRFSLVGVATDITRQRGAEADLAIEKERLAVTLRAMVEAVITTDASGVVRFINAAAAALIERSDVDAIGRPLAEICRFESSQNGKSVEVPFTRVAKDHIAADLPPRTQLVGRDGRKRIVEGCCAPIHGPDSGVTGMVLVFRDVTEQDRLEQELVRATRLESVGILAGGIAHDFNNILTGVMGNLTLAQMEAGASVEMTERLREAEKAMLRARDLTQQLLTFAKGGDPVRTAVKLDAIMHETATFALHGSSVKAIFDVAAGLWTADADKGQIGRVIQNLVINAIQAMPTGGMLRLKACNESIGASGHPAALAPGDYVRIEIADTGEGIQPENLGRVFDPYFTTKQNGSGLGLAAVYSILRKHHGAIDVESPCGRGTTFRLWLPGWPGLEIESPAPAPAKPARFYGRVLFMDDEEIIRKMAVRMLGQFGFEVDCAVEGRETVEKYRAAHARGEPYTLVIMDLTVPGGFGGREAIVQLREFDPHVRAIVSSGYSSDPVLANYRAHGFCGVMAKPYQLEDILRAIREALAG